jgi:hypothetical protein
LPVITVAFKPGVPFSTRKAASLSFSSRAQIMVTSAKEALPIQRFSPSITYSSSSRRAVVSSNPASEPCCGSVRPKAPIFSILAIGGSHCSFCSSDPSVAMEVIATPECTAKNVVKPPSPRANSLLTRPAAVALIFGQPYPLMVVPAMLSAAILGSSSKGNSSLSQ